MSVQNSVIHSYSWAKQFKGVVDEVLHPAIISGLRAAAVYSKAIIEAQGKEKYGHSPSLVIAMSEDARGALARVVQPPGWYIAQPIPFKKGMGRRQLLRRPDLLSSRPRPFKQYIGNPKREEMMRRTGRGRIPVQILYLMGFRFRRGSYGFVEKTALRSIWEKEVQQFINRVGAAI